MRKRCKICGCYLDPGEWCNCEEEAPQVDQPRRQVTYKPTITPREYDSPEYIRQKWLEFDMR